MTFRKILWPPTQGYRQVKKCGVDIRGERGVRAYNGDLRKALIAGSRGRAPGQGSGKAPGGWKPFSFWMPSRSSKFASFSVFWKLMSQAPKVTASPPHISLPLVKTRWNFINLRNNQWQKWVDMSTPVYSVATSLLERWLSTSDNASIFEHRPTPFFRP